MQVLGCSVSERRRSSTRSQWGAHAIPKTHQNNRKGYIDMLINEALPMIEAENLADYMDVFCEENYFTVDEMERLLVAGIKHGLKPKVHVNQFNALGAIEAAVKHKAVSVDHLEEILQLLRSEKCISSVWRLRDGGQG